MSSGQPGACFADDAIPADVSPRLTASAYCRTSAGSTISLVLGNATKTDLHTITKGTYTFPGCKSRITKRQNEGHLPMTGFLGSVLTSATGLYAQFIPQSLSSFAEAAETFSARCGDPVADRAIAPGLMTPRQLGTVCHVFSSTYN